MNAHDFEPTMAPNRAAQNLSRNEADARTREPNSFESQPTHATDNSLRLAITPRDLDFETTRRHVRAVLDSPPQFIVVLDLGSIGSPDRALARRLTRWLAALSATGRVLRLQNLHVDLHAALEALGSIPFDSQLPSSGVRSSFLESIERSVLDSNSDPTSPSNNFSSA